MRNQQAQGRITDRTGKIDSVAGTRAAAGQGTALRHPPHGRDGECQRSLGPDRIAPQQKNSMRRLDLAQARRKPGKPVFGQRLGRRQCQGIAIDLGPHGREVGKIDA